MTTKFFDMTRKQELEAAIQLFQLQLKVIRLDKDNIISRRGQKFYKAKIDEINDKIISAYKELKNL